MTEPISLTIDVNRSVLRAVEHDLRRPYGRELRRPDMTSGRVAPKTLSQSGLRGERGFLTKLPLFSGLPEADLDRLYHAAEPVSIQAGELLMEEGSMADALYVVLDGTFEVSKRSGRREMAVGERHVGEVVGEMSLLARVPRLASVRAVTDGRLLKINQASFERFLASDPSAVPSILRTVMARLGSTEAMLRQDDKMDALGTMAAGLAHQLNNPAAAVSRGAVQSRQTLAEWQRLSAELETMPLEPHQRAAIHALRGEMLQHATAPLNLDSLTRSDREDELQAWLEERRVACAWELAPTLVALGWDVPTLETAAAPFSSDQLPVVIQWLEVGSATFMLLDEVGHGAARISEIVQAVKAYTYLDQAPVQNVQVHAGLENTLAVLRHRLPAGVTVRREYAPDLPIIEAFGSELNQVWTNIIDNALDAMGGEGELSLRTYTQNGQVVVEIADNGPGIPPEIQSRIFEPFFTTKAPGVGRGLGLHVAYHIVAEMHHGQIQITSQPGATRFQVTLPVQLAETTA